MVVGCQPYAPAAFTPRNIPGTHFHYGLSRPQGHGLVGRKYVTEKSSDNTGNRSRDRPTSSAAPKSGRWVLALALTASIFGIWNTSFCRLNPVIILKLPFRVSLWSNTFQHWTEENLNGLNITLKLKFSIKWKTTLNGDSLMMRVSWQVEASDLSWCVPWNGLNTGEVFTLLLCSSTTLIGI